MRFSPLIMALAAGAVLAPAGAAYAQSVGGYALDQLEPAPVGDAFFGVPAPWAGGHLVPRAMLMFDYAHRPLRFSTDAGETAIVAAQGFLHANLSFALWDRLLFSVDAPFAILQSGEDPGFPGVDFHPPNKAQMGDLRLGARFRIAGAYTSPFQVGVGTYFYAPTAPSDSYAGEGAARGNIHLLLGGRAGSGVGFVWSASSGIMLRGSSNPHSLTFGGGVALALGEDRFQIGPELYGSHHLGGTPLTLPSNIGSPGSTNLELLMGAKLRLGGFVLGAAAGPGLLNTIGAPVVRALGTIAWSPKPKDRSRDKEKVKEVGDRDDDGIRDDIDACPDTKGEPSSDPTKDGCPPSDRDGDGVLDVEDACPNKAGVRNVDATKNGCPTDRDEDGVYDDVDACPEVVGVASSNPKQNGCPSDKDGDGVYDTVDACPTKAGPTNSDPKWNGCPEDPDGDGIKGALDACPNEKGSPDPDPKQNGCPKLVRFEGDEIKLRKQIEFEVYGKTRFQTVRQISNDVLTDVRDVIMQHPEIELIEVQGHTDDSGDEEFNQNLSQERAEAVRKWLIEAGVPADKLVAKGYGYMRPLADNRIRQGRQMNRRVQLFIVKRKGQKK